MYVKIKYTCESMRSQEDDERLNEVLRKFSKDLEGLSLEEQSKEDFEENYLHFESKAELDTHIDGMIDFLRETNEVVVTKVEIVDIPKEEYLEWVTFKLTHAICQRYAASINLEFKSIRDENIHCRDKDFLIKAYEYALDVLEDNSENPFAKNDILV